jgi:hypothetical protein
MSLAPGGRLARPLRCSDSARLNPAADDVDQDLARRRHRIRQLFDRKGFRAAG